ncbi:MAG: rRNA pseudouridine synthase [Planctomycetes bacterium]|nr:rRNA pseudouridine synthase [Planctomycetota bacterium]
MYRRKNAGGNAHDAETGFGLARVLSKLGFASRTESADLIKAGKVKVNGRVIRDPERRTFAGRESVLVDDRPIHAVHKIYLVMNKLEGVLTSYTDPQNRPTVYKYLPQLDSWVFPVGRLDAKTSGLLIFTNDTQLGEKLTNSEFGVPKTYEVKVRRKLNDEAIERLRRGVRLDDGYVTKPCQCTVMKANEGSTWLEMTIIEGKNRQIRRMIESVGSEVSKLRRTAIACVRIGELKGGTTRDLTAEEIEALRRL